MPDHQSTTTALILRHLNDKPVAQRPTDGYINATQLCKAAGKLWGSYARNQETQEFLEELSTSMQIRIDVLVQPITTGPNDQRGTWVHPRVAYHLGQWCSPQAAVQVTAWLEELHTTGTVSLRKGSSLLTLAKEDIQVWSELATLFHAPQHVALQEGVKYVEKTYGLDFRPLLLASPITDAIPDVDVMLEPTEIAARLGYPSAQVLNKALETLGWQTKYTGVWEATDLGSPHCSRHAWINKGKSGYNYRWRLEAVREALA